MQADLLTLPAIKQAQKRNMAALKQRNQELEHTLQQANLLILALNTMIETAEKDGGARATTHATKRTDPKKV